jgi:catechol 2,3-dioxygenase-like lactoylglutathione lyase family enzyme
MVKGINHVSFIVSDAEVAREFYQSVLGLALVTRPNLGFPGYWMDLGGGQTLHLLAVDDPYHDVPRPHHPGRDRHLALGVANLESVITRLAEHKVAYKVSQSGRSAVFFYDPDLNVIELTEV